MPPAPPSVLPEELEQYKDFARHGLRQFGRQLPRVIWHYTDANGLIGIIKSGSIYCTQIACLNDSLEQAYLGDLILEVVRKRLLANSDANLLVFLKFAERALDTREFSAAGRFVACFSEHEDDLGQWRGYGGGQCGYAIGFLAEELFNAVTANRPSTLMIPMNYLADRHAAFVADAVEFAEAQFQKGIARGIEDISAWAAALFEMLAIELDVFANVFKHPKFSSEFERRIAIGFNIEQDLPNMMFRQKQTLMARMLSIDISHSGPPRRLPIANVWIGPGPGQNVSRISVGDLLVQHGYRDIPVMLSSIPYRVV